MNERKKVKFKDIASFISHKTSVDNATVDNYISTVNMLPEKQGVSPIDEIPIAKTVNQFKKEDILISNIRPYFKKIWYAKGNGTNSGDVLVIRRKSEEADNKYLYYSLFDDNFFNFMMSGSKGTKMPRGDKEAIKNYEIPLPPLPTQRRIAAILSALDDKIENNRKICDTLEQIAQAVFKRWFVDEKNEDWTESKLEEVAKITMGQSPPSISYNFNGDGLPFFQGSKEFGWRKPTIEKWCNDPKRLAEKGDILISVRAPVGDMNIASAKSCIGRGLASVRGKAVPTSVLYYALKNGIQKIQNLASGGSVFDSLNKKALSEVIITIPPISIRESLYNQIDSIFVLINKLDDENQILQQTRDTLLPKLMSGEVEV